MDSSRIINRLPEFWNTDPGSKLRAIIDAINTEISQYADNVMYLDDMVGIDGTVGNDIDTKWGKLLNITRRLGEDDTKYRNRIKTTINNMSGGTSDSIRYAVAVAIGIDNDTVATEQRIQVYDAWKYAGPEPIYTDYGYIVCMIDMQNILLSDVDALLELIHYTVDSTCVAGTKVQLLYKNFIIATTYGEMLTKTYGYLQDYRYSNLGVPK